MSETNYRGWKRERDSIVADDGRVILMQGVALTTGCNRKDQAEARENARLLFAAPDLLEACRAALAAFGDTKLHLGAVSEKDADRFAAVLQLTAAIEKATGEPPAPSSA